jgi:hypothetical protein
VHVPLVGRSLVTRHTRVVMPPGPGVAVRSMQGTRWPCLLGRYSRRHRALQNQPRAGRPSPSTRDGAYPANRIRSRVPWLPPRSRPRAHPDRCGHTRSRGGCARAQRCACSSAIGWCGARPVGGRGVRWHPLPPRHRPILRRHTESRSRRSLYRCRHRRARCSSPPAPSQSVKAVFEAPFAHPDGASTFVRGVYSRPLHIHL